MDINSRGNSFYNLQYVEDYYKRYSSIYKKGLDTIEDYYENYCPLYKKIIDSKTLQERYQLPKPCLFTENLANEFLYRVVKVQNKSSSAEGVLVSAGSDFILLVSQKLCLKLINTVNVTSVSKLS